MTTYLLFLLGFGFLIKGADLLVAGASSIAKRFNVSDLVIGLTVVAFGTSTPELFVNVVASLRGNTDIAIGNVLGSNIANVFLILGVAAIICPLTVSKGTVWKEIPFSLLAALVLSVLANDVLIDGADISQLTRVDGLVLIAFFLIFLYYSFGIAKPTDVEARSGLEGPTSLFASLARVFGGMAGLILGGKWIVEGAVDLATDLGMSESMVGLTVVAIGTSLPELAASAMAAYRKNVEIAVGNVVGSSIFNIFLVLGTSATIKPLPLGADSNRNISVVILSGLILFLFMFTGQKRSVDKWEGYVLVGLYAGYITYTIMAG